MKTRYFALIYGIVFAIIGIAGFFPGLLTEADVDTSLVAEGLHGQLFGLFPVNWLHNLVHLAFGVWGLAAYRSFSGARMYAKSVAVIYAVFAVMGFIPLLRTTFGLIPLYGNDIWLHIVLALIAAYFGFGNPDKAEATRTTAA